MSALRTAAIAVMLVTVVLWWLPSIALAVATLGMRDVRFSYRMARVRSLTRAGRLDEATAALARVRRDFGVAP